LKSLQFSKVLQSVLHDQRTDIRRTRSWTTKFGSFVTSVGALNNAVTSIVDGDAFPGCVTLELISTACSHCMNKIRFISIKRKSTMSF